ncbi:MAG: 5-formyltetrahydrofolate cyclo-ligase [Lachnospiraceae bacterium]
MREEKAKLRRRMIQQRYNLTSQQVYEDSNKIQEQVRVLLERKQPDLLLLYADYNQEVNTKKLFEYALTHHITAAYPRVEGEEMNFYPIIRWEEMAEGYRGILEPTGDAHVIPTKRSVVIVPGTAFDRGGNRMGYGGGYYDKYLARYQMMYRIGIAYDFQIVERVPVEPTDCRLDAIVTPDEVLQMNR